MREKNNKKPTKKVVRMSNVAQSRPAKKKNVGVVVAKATFKGILKTILTIILILTIVVCVVGTAGIIVVMQYVDSTVPMDITDIDLGYTTTVYGKNSAGEDEEILKISAGGYREWESIDNMPQILLDAFVYTEDERYLNHEGVDWLRTVAAFISMIGPEISVGGGSTITQQLIKNINGDFYNRTSTVKMKEILSALNLERNYTKSQILEAYLNYLTLGTRIYGVKAAAYQYFGIEDLNQLTVAQAASLACIAQSPNNLNPRSNPVENAERRKYTLGKMLEHGSITEAQYNEALVADIGVLETAPETVTGQTETGVYNWFVDAALYQVRDDLVAEYGYSTEEAMEKIKSGGYQIYTTVNIDMQKRLEQLFLDDSLFGVAGWQNIPEAAMVIMDHQGNIQALVGGRTQKTESMTWNRATQDPRSGGSTMKPITTYAPALQSNLITWSTMYMDEPKKTLGNGREWPNNWNYVWERRLFTVEEALKKSKNTVPVEIMQQLGVNYCFDFLTEQLKFSSLDADSIDMSENLTLGMTSKGVYLDELTASYNIFANGGYLYESTTYSKVLDTAGKTVLASNTNPTQVLDTDTSYIMNKLLWQVVNASGGTGGQAKISNITTIGKTGTSDENKESIFVGSTPYYTAGIRTAYDQLEEYANLDVQGAGNIYAVWRKIMTEFHTGLEDKAFDISDEGVVQASYCTQTGLLRGASCVSSATGYYKEGKQPSVCNYSHSQPTTEE